MGFLTRLFGLERFGPTSSPGEPDGWLVRVLGGGKTNAGVAVSEYTAMQLPAVYACVNRIANPVASFPLRIYRSKREGGAELVTDPKAHPLARTLGLRPNPFMSSRTLRKTSQGHALLSGNGYLEIERNVDGQAVGLWPLLWDRTRPIRENGDIFFRTTIAGRTFDIAHGNVIHLMDQSQDGYIGVSPVAMARQAIGIGLATEEFGAKFFANDAKSGGFLMHPGKLSPQAISNLKAGETRGKEGEKRAAPENPASRIERQGGLDNAHRVKVLEEGMKFVPTTIPPEDAQFLGTREFQIAEIARIYDVPLILLQSHEKTTSWGTGIEQLMIGFVMQTIAPWVQAWEQELNWKLFTEGERAAGFFVKFNMNALLRGDMEARAAFYEKMFQMAGLSINQLLALEDMDPIGPTGDERFVSSNVQSLKTVLNPPPAQSGGHHHRSPKPSCGLRERSSPAANA